MAVRTNKEHEHTMNLKPVPTAEKHSTTDFHHMMLILFLQAMLLSLLSNTQPITNKNP